MVIYQEGILFTYKRANDSDYESTERVTKSEWTGMRLSSLEDKVKKKLGSEAVGLLLEAGNKTVGRAYTIYSNINDTIESYSFDKLERTVFQEFLYEEFSVPAFRIISGPMGHPEATVTELSYDPKKTGVTKWQKLKSWPETQYYRRGHNPNLKWE